MPPPVTLSAENKGHSLTPRVERSALNYLKGWLPMIRPRVITIDCETLPEQIVRYADEEAAVSADSLDVTQRSIMPATDDAAMAGSSNPRDNHRSALNGDTGRLLCIGFIDEGGGQRLVKGVLGWDRERGCFIDDETQILRDFWEMMRTFRPCLDRIVGHNIYNFDLPFIYKRSVICGVRPSIELNFARYRNQPIYDTMATARASPSCSRAASTR